MRAFFFLSLSKFVEKMNPFFGILVLILIVFSCVYFYKHLKLDSILGTTKIEKKENNVIYGTWKSYGTPNKGTFEAKLPKRIEYDTEFKVDVVVRNWLAGNIQGTNFVGMISKSMEITQTNTKETDKQIEERIKRVPIENTHRDDSPCMVSSIKMSGVILGSEITYKAVFNDKMDAIVGGYKLKNAFQSGRDDIGYFGGETRNRITIHD